MKQAFLILATLGLVFAAPSIDLQDAIDLSLWEPNGTYPYHPSIGGRIIGGVAATIQQVPSQVALLRNGAQICGGILVGARVVLTAAHCVVPSVISSVSQLNIRAGSTNHNSGGLRVAVSKIVYHERYQDCSTCAPDYDIAAVHLSSNAIVSGLPAASIGLWDASTNFNAGEIGTVSGWGTTSEGGYGTTQLRRVDVPVVSLASCRAVYGSIISSRTVCAGLSNGGKDACQGDSGGPYIIDGKLAGIVSFGSGCARAGYPGVYSSIPGYRSWIATHAGV